MSETLQLILVALTIAAAITTVIVKMVRRFRSGHKSTGCDCCSSDSPCPFNKDADKCRGK